MIVVKLYDLLYGFKKISSILSITRITSSRHNDVLYNIASINQKKDIRSLYQN